MKKPFKRLSEARGAVVRFLKANPLSTREVIYEATKVNILCVLRKGMFKNVLYNGERCWRVVSNPQDFVR